MSSSAIEPKAQAAEVVIDKEEFSVRLRDGRTITVPLAWYPRLSHGTARERSNCASSARAKASTGLIWTRT